MPDKIPVLWPEEFKIDVQSPLAILRVQANSLSAFTSGILEGVVETETAEKRVQHRLVVIAPAYGGYRHTLIAVLHDADLPYPAEVRAEGLKKKEEPGPISPFRFGPEYPIAHDDNQMQELVQKALASAQTRAVILSLIAKSNETG